MSAKRGTILVTGGAGYVGSHACKALHRAGYRVVVVDNLVYGHPEAVKWGDLHRLDLQDTESLAAVMEKVRPESVLHFAAYAYVGESVADPAKYYRNNVVGTLSLLEAMRRMGCKRLVFSSTCAVYGVPDSIPIRETTPKSPINPYGRSKLMMEQILGDYGAAYGFRSVSLRYFNAAGADPDGELGEDHDPETHLIPLVLQTALGRRKEVTVFGTDYPTSDGTCVRDYIHVSDLAEAHVLALKYLESGGETTALNLGTGKGCSVQEVIALAREVTRRPVPVANGARRPGDPPVLLADASLARKVLGWKPAYPEVRTQIEHAWRWVAASET